MPLRTHPDCLGVDVVGSDASAVSIVGSVSVKPLRSGEHFVCTSTCFFKSFGGFNTKFYGESSLGRTGMSVGMSSTLSSVVHFFFLTTCWCEFKGD